MNDDGAIELYSFRYRDGLTGRWVKARYKATPANIASVYAEWSLDGPVEVRRPVGSGHFNPLRAEGR